MIDQTSYFHREMQIAGKNFNVITMTVNKDYYVKSQNSIHRRHIKKTMQITFFTSALENYFNENVYLLP